MTDSPPISVDFYGLTVSFTLPNQIASEYLRNKFRYFPSGKGAPAITIDYHFKSPPIPDHESKTTTPETTIPPQNKPFTVQPHPELTIKGSKHHLDVYFRPNSIKNLARLLKNATITKNIRTPHTELWRNFTEFYLFREAALPFIQWHLAQKNIYPLHAAALKKGKEVSVFIGMGGVGKTTLALSLLKEHYTLLGDNIVYSDGKRILPFPDSIRCSTFTKNLFPELSFSPTPILYQHEALLKKSQIHTRPEVPTQFFFLHRGSPIRTPLSSSDALRRWNNIADSLDEFFWTKYPSVIYASIPLPDRNQHFKSLFSDHPSATLQYNTPEELKFLLKSR